MLKLVAISSAILMTVTLAGAASNPVAEPAPRAKPSSPEAAREEAGVARYCKNAGASVAEIRLASQIKRLGELETEIKSRVELLEKKTAEAREWVSKREELMQKASDGVVAIFEKMDPEAAALRLSAMDDDEAAVAVLSKLRPGVAGGILNEMEAARAGHIAKMLSGMTAGANKS